MGKESIPRKINTNVFDQWTHKNAWALGLLMADGGFAPNSRPNEFCFYNTDVLLIVEYREVFETDKRIELHRKAKTENQKDCYYIRLSSKKIADFLKEIESFGKKCTRRTFKYIPNEFRWSYLKGLLDGNGNIYKGRLKMTGYREEMELINKWICAEIGKDGSAALSKGSTPDTVVLQFSKSDSKKIVRRLETWSIGTYDSKQFKKFQEETKENGVDENVSRKNDRSRGNVQKAEGTRQKNFGQLAFIF